MEPRRRALLIGSASFRQLSPLPTVPSDLSLLSAALLSPEAAFFNSVEVKDMSGGPASKESIMSAIEEFFRVKQPGLDLLYIASHAVVDAYGSLRIAFEDFDASCPISSTIPLSFLASCLQHVDDRPAVIIVTVHDLFPRSCQIIFRRHSQIPFRPDRPTAAIEHGTVG